MKRQKKVLLSLLSLFLLSLVYAYWMMPEQRRLPAEVVSAPVAKRQNSLPETDKTRLRVDLLDKQPSRYKGANRDIFNYAKVKTKPEPKPAPKPAPVVAKPVVPAPVPVLNQVARQQLARFTFLGFLIKDERRTVFLKRGADLFLVQEGETFGDDNQFTALAISPEEMTINQAGDSRTINILLVEKESLIPSLQQSLNVNTTSPQEQNLPAGTLREPLSGGTRFPVKR
jgi:hypothetical protein